MKSKLGIVVLHTNDLSLDWFRQTQCEGLIVSMDHDYDYWKKVREICPKAFILGRVYSEAQPLDPDFWFKLIEPQAVKMAGIYDAWMGENERTCTNIPEAEELRKFHFDLAQKMHERGWKLAAYSFSEGNPANLNLWPYLANHGCDYLALHEYDAPEMWRSRTILSQSGFRGAVRRAIRKLPLLRKAEPEYIYWRCGRFIEAQKRIPPQYRVPILIGETGIDGGVSGIDRPQSGWRDFGDEAHYLQSLQWYDSLLQAHPEVIGAAIFAAAWDTGHRSFDMADATKIASYIGSSGSSPDPSPTPSPIPQPRPLGQLLLTIAAFEGFRATWYNDQGGKAIGYGHQGLPEEIRLWTAPMQRWQAVEVLRRDITSYIAAVEGAVRVPISSNQWVALCSLAYNIGIGAFQRSDLLRYLNNKDYNAAARELVYQDPNGEWHGWIHAGGRVIEALIDRRYAERTLFESSV